MLDSLDDVEWDELQDAYGAADGIPELLRDLTAADADIRREALEQLWMGLCHQRVTLYSASAAAVPFLIELGSHREVKDRGGILELLQGMAEAAGSSPDTRSALAAQTGIVLGLLSDADADVRARAALVAVELVRAEASRAEAFADTLAKKLGSEPAADTRVAFVEALDRLSALAPLRTALADGSFAVRLAAALALVRFDEPGAASFEIVRAALLASRASREQYGEAARFRPLQLVKASCAAGEAAARTLLPELLAHLARTSAQGADHELAPLLRLFLPRGLPARPTLEQSALVATIAQHRGYFGRNANADAVLAAHGLPARPALLRANARLGPPEHTALVPRLPALPPPAELLASLVGKRAPEQVEALFLVGVASDELLALLPGLPRLRQLAIKSATAGAAGFAALRRLECLELLWLEDLALDAAGARHLADMPCLATLTLLDVSPGEGALALLRAAPRITELTIEGRPGRP